MESKKTIEENKVIYSLAIWRKLVEKGNIPTETLPNPINPKYNCWVFPMTEKFKKDLDEVLGERASYGRG